ncbi:MAG TPA: hypothetical protein VFD13_04100 [Candidatus Kapabacteria bacterium]|nr:hypothetical protein [Candidatus Kapabacteria bacterium]
MLRSVLIAALFLSVGGCSTATAPMNSIRLNFAFKAAQPANDSLYPVFPNPFNRVAGDTSLGIQFALRDSGSAQIVIQNVLGDQIDIFSDSTLRSGYYTGWWNPLASDGTRLINGLYFITLRNGDFIFSRLVDVQENQ